MPRGYSKTAYPVRGSALLLRVTCARAVIMCQVLDMVTVTVCPRQTLALSVLYP